MKSSRGFTLLEMLLAITLLGIFLVLIGSALISTNHTLARSEQFSARLDEIRSAQNFLRRELQQALPFAVNSTRQNSNDVFLGTPQEMRFIARLPPHLGGGLHLQTLRLDGTEGDRWLRIDFAKRMENNTIQAWGEPQHLLRHVDHLRLAYSGTDPAGHPTEWLSRWPWPQRLPQRVRIELNAHGPIAWPSLQVALRLELNNNAPIWALP
ncbi:prepilin-type N-terminal cleavage/methylation domain-containing protein [Phytohalomonas tamaricis]|uniref:prepilin-type N-terminal cleavage/methylation domain-containing protein n=1 Tax=Phytohalomonas tamaricis TaxID=2081032 RepID=UPI000D0B42A2|nr:prepilin-type N-terminal cleavage/methylation domain-containing protein [Phytohalomonas tamaricis]